MPETERLEGCPLRSWFLDTLQSLFGNILETCVWAAGQLVDLEHYFQLSIQEGHPWL